MSSVASPVFQSGDINGAISAATIGGPYSVTQAFNLANSSVLTSVEIGAWVDKGHSPNSLRWSIGSTAFGTDFGTEVVPLAITLLGPAMVGDYWDVYKAVFSLPSVTLSEGDYFLTLSDAAQDSGAPFMWDITSTTYAQKGQQANSYDASHPRSVWEESFTIEGSSTIPEPNSAWLIAAALLAMFAQRQKWFQVRF